MQATTVTIVDSAMTIADQRVAETPSQPFPVLTVADAAIGQAIRPRLRKKIDRFSQISLMTAERLAGHIRPFEHARIGVFLGNDFAGWNYVYDQLAQLIDTRDAAAINPYVATAWFPAAAQGEITIGLDIVGQGKTFSAGVLSGGVAIEYAARVIDDGELDIALTGGVEAPNATPVLKAMTAERRIAPDHPAAESAALLAIAPATRNGAARLTISAPRRSLDRALAAAAPCLADWDRVTCRKISVTPGNTGWRECDEALTGTLKEAFGSRLDVVAGTCDGLDAGSASFPVLVAEASRSCAQGEVSIVVGTDFEGLFLAGAVTPSPRGVN